MALVPNILTMPMSKYLEDYPNDPFDLFNERWKECHQSLKWSVKEDEGFSGRGCKLSKKFKYSVTGTTSCILEHVEWCIQNCHGEFTRRTVSNKDKEYRPLTKMVFSDAIDAKVYNLVFNEPVSTFRSNKKIYLGDAIEYIYIEVPFDPSVTIFTVTLVGCVGRCYLVKRIGLLGFLFEKAEDAMYFKFRLLDR